MVWMCQLAPSTYMFFISIYGQSSKLLAASPFPSHAPFFLKHAIPNKPASRRVIVPGSGVPDGDDAPVTVMEALFNRDSPLISLPS